MDDFHSFCGAGLPAKPAATSVAARTAGANLTRFGVFLHDMGRIAVISAFNCHNYGMYSVDLAAEQFFNELGLPFTQIVTQQRTRTGRLQFHLRRQPSEFAVFDRVVYWGDFLNNPMWGAVDYSHREVQRHGVTGREQAGKNWQELYLNLKRYHPALRVFAIGGCFLGAAGTGLERFRRPLEEFLQSAELVMPRDEPSFEMVQRLAPAGRVRQGMDCAWLLPVEPARKAAASSHFICFLGRTLRRRQPRLAGELARATGLRAVWIDWLNLRPPRFLAHWNFSRMRRLIAGARFVVTDTYHLAVNALNQGIPTICLYDAKQSAEQGTCGDAKKRALMEEAGLAAQLVDVGEPGSLARRIRERLAASDPAEAAAAFAQIAQRRTDFRKFLRQALGKTAPTESAVNSCSRVEVN